LMRGANFSFATHCLFFLEEKSIAIHLNALKCGDFWLIFV